MYFLLLCLLHEHLTWILHINEDARKFYLVRLCLLERYLKILHYSILCLNLHYCISVQGVTYPKNLNRFIVFQKKAVRML